MFVTKEQIVEAFKKTGLEPVRGRFGDGISCACALTALCIAAGHSDLTPHEITDWATNQFGPGTPREIMAGWDGRHLTIFNSGWNHAQCGAAYAAYCELTADKTSCDQTNHGANHA